MAKMVSQKHNLSEFNGGTGNEYGNQALPTQDFTMMAENCAYASEVDNRIKNRGEYSPITQYSILNIVTYQNSVYQYINDTPTIGNLPTDNTYWQVLMFPTTNAAVLQSTGQDGGSTMSQKAITDALDFKSNIDASNLSDENILNWINKLGHGFENNYYTTQTININGYDTLAGIRQTQLAEPNKKLIGNIGALEDTILKSLLGTPTGFANYTRFFTQKIFTANASENTVIIECYALGLIIGKIARGYIIYDSASGTDHWTGWTTLGI